MSNINKISNMNINSQTASLPQSVEERYIYPWHQLRPVRLITHRQHRAQVRLMKLIARERDRRAERHDILLTDS